jgi:hypothetical protein
VDRNGGEATFCGVVMPCRVGDATINKLVKSHKEKAVKI